VRLSFVSNVSLALTFSVSVLADQGAALTGPDAARTYERDKARLLKTAELMPAEHYGSRQVSHDKPFSAQLVAAATMGKACGELLDRPIDFGSEDPQTTIVTKPDVAAALSKGFGMCDAYVRTVANGARPAPDVAAILEHLTSMANYLAVSLRARGIEPPK
jgi:hypothetical protein